jgi:hypothetical protein
VVEFYSLLNQLILNVQLLVEEFEKDHHYLSYNVQLIMEVEMVVDLKYLYSLNVWM